VKPLPETCRGCPAYGWGEGFVEPEGPTDATFLFIGQGPGKQEAMFSRPFFPMAPAGQRLGYWLHRSGLGRHEVLIGNTVQCWLPARKVRSLEAGGLPGAGPGAASQGNQATFPTQREAAGNREPTIAEQQACWDRYVGPWLRRLLEENPRRHLIALGQSAFKFLSNMDPRAFERNLGVTLQVELPPSPLAVGDLPPDPEVPAPLTQAPLAQETP